MKYNKSKSEFEREAVPENQLKSWKSFLGMYSGEHTAGTEFMIGPLFLTVGVSAFDLLAGLFLGNLMAVLSWRFMTADLAVKERFTLYFKLEKISGKKLVVFYNVANGILFCFLAGSMITVSATAVGVPTGLEMPKLTDVMPKNISWIVIVIIIGSRLGIPLSTTHCQVGATMGVAALDDLKTCSGINWKIAFKVFAGWIITLVVVGSTSALITAQGIYAPTNDECPNYILSENNTNTT